MDLSDRVTFQNRHWGIGKLEIIPAKKRELFSRIWSDIDIKPMILLTGLRRTGKSVLLKQIAQELIEKKSISPTQILLFEFAPNDKPDTIWEVFRYFQKQITNTQMPEYIFFDEIQLVDNYESVIKEIYDTSGNLKIGLTGSLSLSYKKRMQESLGGRFLPYRLFPLNFNEYLTISGSSDKNLFGQLKHGDLPEHKRKPLLEVLNGKFREFLLWRRLPEMIHFTPVQGTAYLSTVLGQSLTQDAFNYFTIEKPQVLTAIFEYIKEQNGGIISIQSLSQKLGTGKETVSKYLNILEIMGLCYPVYNTTQPLIKLNSAKKIYVGSMFALLETKLNWETAIGFAVESYVLERLLEKGHEVTFYRQRQKEIDFLIPKEKRGFEVKFRKKLTKMPILANYQIEPVTLDGINPACLF